MSANPEVDFSDLGNFCKKVFLTHAVGTPDDFLWTETLQPVDDSGLKAKLFDKAVDVLVSSNELSFAVPEIIEWDDVAHFAVTCLPEQKFLDPEDFDLKVSLEKLEKPKAITLASLRKWKLNAFDQANDLVHGWPLLRCLSGQFEFDAKTYVMAEGEFFRVASDFISKLDAFIDTINSTELAFPTAVQDPPEGEYNEQAANSSVNYLLMDKKMVKLTSQTSAIEACDLLTIDGAFIHVKRKLGSSSLSHLFAQGSVSADLLLMSSEFRTKIDEKIEIAEGARALATGDQTFNGKFPRFSGKSVTPSCPSSYKMEHQSGLSIGGSGSFV